jgi:hypothetical protein
MVLEHYRNGQLHAESTGASVELFLVEISFRSFWNWDNRYQGCHLLLESYRSIPLRDREIAGKRQVELT